MPDTNALHKAAKEGNHAKVRSHVSHLWGENDEKALFRAALEGRIEVVKELLTYNPNVNYANDKGWTALIKSALYGRTEIAKALLKVHDINVNLANNQGVTALICAACEGETEVVRDLLKVHDINVNHACIKGFTALIAAAQNGRTEIIQALLKVHGINVNHANNQGITALMKATEKGHTEIVKALLKVHGINVNHADHDGKMAIDEAKTEEIRNLLRGGITVLPPTPDVPFRTILKEVVPPPRHVPPVRPYVGSAIMSFRNTSTSVLASGRSVAAHAAAATSEVRAAQKMVLMLDALCQDGKFGRGDLSTVTRVLAKPTGQSVVFGGMYKGQQVAVKIFRDRTTKGTAANEVAYQRRCVHRHVLGVLDTYEYNERALLVMPLARGDLQAVIEKAEGPLPHDLVTGYAKQLATGLAYLHEIGVSHLDVKAGNVFIAMSDGRAMLADFGMAMDIRGSRDKLLACGTPMFMAPELWAQRLGETVQRGNRAKVDVYAFGCMVWQLMTRQLPFQREIENDGWVDNDFLLLATAVRRDRRSPGEAGMLESHWPEPLRRVIQACCAYEPDSRPTMTQVLAEYLR